MQETQVIEIRRWGNSAGVLLPKEWLGKQAKVILIDRSEEIKKEVLDILNPYLDDIEGIYLVGSRARGDFDENSDIDILAISESVRKNISSGKYNIEIYPFESVKNILMNNSLMIYPRLKEAKAILNNSLLKSLKSTKITEKSIHLYIEDCREIIKINKGLLKISKDLGNKLDTKGILYSLILRLRGIYLINVSLSNKRYSNKNFIEWLSNGTKLEEKEVINIYDLYRETRDNKKVKDIIPLEYGLRLTSFLEEEIKKYGKKKKKA